jgi:transcriptional regulator GlxA family with amidase domain
VCDSRFAIGPQDLARFAAPPGFVLIVGASAEVRDLAAVLEAQPTATLASAASSLAVSKRTLQRVLAEHGSSFRGELDAARVRVAQRLLRESSERIARVAIEVGCSSPQQLSGLFRRVVGESPREWRARVRGAP